MLDRMQLRNRDRWLRIGVLLGWLSFVAATQQWRPWSDSVRLDYATDVQEFATIARAAPGFPDVKIQTPHADRFPAHWLVGELANLTDIPLHAVYALATALVLATSLAALAASLRSLGCDLRTYAVAVGLFAASAYPFRYLLDAPGMLTDALFVLGLALTAHAFASGRYRWLLLGIAIATIGRQTALPLTLVAGLLVLREPRWRSRRSLRAVAPVLVGVVLYAVPHAWSAAFADTSGRGLIGMSLLGGSWTGRELAVHVARAVIAVLVPAAVIAATALRTRSWPPLAGIALAGIVWIQAVALAPDWTHAEPRLAGLALPALAVTAAAQLRSAELSGRVTASVGAAIGVASLHHLYSRAGELGATGWGIATAVAAVAVLAVLAARSGTAVASARPGPATSLGRSR